jgi:hypothetical protein
MPHQSSNLQAFVTRYSPEPEVKEEQQPQTEEEETTQEETE